MESQNIGEEAPEAPENRDAPHSTSLMFWSVFCIRHILR